MKIAIIGTGISGLTAAYILNKIHRITVFEKNDYIGGHTHTHSINTGEANINVDSGFIVYNENTYPNFIKLLDQLNVERQKTTMGFSVKSDSDNFEYSGSSLNAMFSQRSNLFRPLFYKMITDIIKFNKYANNDLHTLSEKMTLSEYLSNKKFSKSFINHYIVPMGAAIWSTKADSILNIPAFFFIRFFKNHGLLQIFNRPDWWVIKGGSNQYVKKLIKPFQTQIRINSPITKIRRTDSQVFVSTGCNNTEEVFDKVIIATHSNQALKMLSDPTKSEEEILKSIQFQNNKAILHTDTSVLPNRKLAWASWNYYLDHLTNKPVSLTYNMNILQNLNSSKTFCVTLNNNQSINNNQIIKYLDYDHPLFNSDATKAQNRKEEINGKNNTYYCGAYWHNGFHEDGVVSALEVCQKFGLSL